MGFFGLKSFITVGSFKFEGVHEVHIRRSIHSYADMATIVIPARSRTIKGNNATVLDEVTAQKFTDGDEVSINLGYNDDTNSEFVGFVKSRGTGMPLVLECEGYVRQLRLNVNINKDFSKTNTSAKDLLKLATQGTDIDVICDVEFPLSGIKIVNNNGAQICDYIKEASDHTLTIFFIGARTLWCGLTYTAYAAGKDPFHNSSIISYRLGWNCPRENGLRKRIPAEPVQIIMCGKLATGMTIRTASKERFAQNKVKSLLNHVSKEETIKQFAQEKEYNMNYSGYEGKLIGYLQPYGYPGISANIENADFKELNGTYLVEDMEVAFGQRGARRVLGLGPRLGFDKS